MLDLGYPGDTYVRGGGDLLLAQAQLLAGLGEPVPALPARHPCVNDLETAVGTDACAVSLTFGFRNIPKL